MKVNLNFRDQSLIDYTICSFNCLRLLLDFEVLETDSLISDGHAIIAWSMTTHFCHNTKNHGNNNICFKKWDQRHVNDFINNIRGSTLDNIYANLEPTKSSINHVTSQIALTLTQAAKLSFPVKNKSKRRSKDKTFYGPNCRAATSN